MSININTVSPIKNPAHDFSRSPSIDIERSTFQRDSSHKTTLLGDGSLIPIFCDEALPADTWSMDMQSLIRMTTPITPFLDNVYATVHFWCVPKRLVWEHFEDFICGKMSDDGTALRYEYPFQHINPQYLTVGSIYDYFGLPIMSDQFTGSDLSVNELPFRAYNLIWNEWYRQDHIQDKLDINRGDSGSHNIFRLRKRGKRHDYFTSALPWPQLGPAVTLPLGGTAPVIGNGQNIGMVAVGSNTVRNVFLHTNNQAWSLSLGSTAYTPTGSPTSAFNETKPVRFSTNKTSGSTGLVTDLSNATAISINDMREAFQLQRMFERDARSGGQRYTEVLLAHFKTISPDGRLQRPEYLGGNTVRFIVSPLAQTSSTSGTSPQGNLAAVAACTGNVKWTHSFTEHCYVIGLIELSTDLTYQQGLNRMWSRRTRYDEYWPVFAHLGEQPVLNKEIYCDGSSNDDGIFGYQERYAEYRYKPSMITGSLRSNAPQSLDFWHLGQYYTSLPRLNATFIEDSPPFERVSAVSSADSPPFIADMLFRLKCTRPLPLYSVPGMADHY